MKNDVSYVHHKEVWREPYCLLTALDSVAPYVFLYSSLSNEFTGRFSWIALFPECIIQAPDWQSWEEAITLSASLPLSHHPLLGRWFGYLGYELLHDLESVPSTPESSIPLPRLWMMKPQAVIVFDHLLKEVDLYAKDAHNLDQALQLFHHSASDAVSEAPSSVNITQLHTNLPQSLYLERLQVLKEAILNGELYQANITRKIWGHADTILEERSLFKALCQHSPAPYSALLKLDSKRSIISNSPEQFLAITSKGEVSVRPIKGTAGRVKDLVQDEQIRISLMNCPKNKAENLMIVDLMRHDIGKHCEIGSIQVQSLFDITSYATIHHLSSHITGRKRSDASVIELIKGCFPPGSMTGAPKKKAMEWCAKLEQINRGVYSGAIGWVHPLAHTSEMSVVIRTLICEKNRFEFQVGGGIVADSNPLLEWEETLHKARAIAQILGIEQQLLQQATL